MKFDYPGCIGADMSAHSTTVVEEFCALCNKAYAVWRIHKVLFEDNPRKKELERSVAGKALVHLSIISQEYLLHEISKLHDPAIQQNHANLGVEYMVRFGGWDKTTEAKLQALQMQLNELDQKIRPARHKILSHNDLETILRGDPLGEFPKGMDDDYFKTLQEFVNVVNDSVIGGPSPFSEDASIDADALLSFFKE
jgi:hypothetical protein